jgi:hypothetical protein
MATSPGRGIIHWVRDRRRGQQDDEGSDLVVGERFPVDGHDLISARLRYGHSHTPRS